MGELSDTEQTFVAMVRREHAPVSSLLDAAPAALPWTRPLPVEDARTFVAELAESLRTADSADDPAAAATAQLITEWRHTAEVHAEPELFARLTTEAE
ncbi:MAG: hypothetical protein IJH84_12855, partial [Saccharopolyspora sp.]|nr:hypothetical protein [Saccharopolyspora sp.]